MSRREFLTRELSRCVIGFAPVCTWTNGSRRGGSWEEDPEQVELEEVRAELLLSRLRPAMEVVLDEFEMRGIRMQKEPIAGTAKLWRKERRLTLEFSCTRREAGLAIFSELFHRLDKLLSPEARPLVFSPEGFLETVDRFTRLQPRHRRLARWLELANRVELARAKLSNCRECGGTAVDIREEWFDTDFDASPRNQTDAICLDEPHVVTTSFS